MTIAHFPVRYVCIPFRKLKLFFYLLSLIATRGFGQLSTEESALVARINFSTVIPIELLSTRSVVIYQSAFTKKELEETQSFFQQTGIDAVAYFDVARVLAGYDPQKAYATYFQSRGIKFLILLQKTEKGYQFLFCPFSGNKELVTETNVSWKQEHASLTELLKTIYRFAVSNLKKENFLINDLPETDISVKFFAGRINETFANEVKIFKVAIPRLGNLQDDAELEAYLKENFPVKYDLVDKDANEPALLDKGYKSILRFVHARGVLAKEILGYDITQLARSLPTATIVNNEVQIKTISATQPIYKFYFKNIEYGNVFLGNKWDADTTWQDALRNHIQALKLNQKIN
jgi:hypothetical protein